MEESIKSFIETKFEELQKQLIMNSKNVWSVKELAHYTGLSRGYIYNLVASHKIPHYKTDGGKLTFFKKQEIENWLCASYVPTYKEMEQKAIAHCLKGGVK